MSSISLKVLLCSKHIFEKYLYKNTNVFRKVIKFTRRKIDNSKNFYYKNILIVIEESNLHFLSIFELIVSFEETFICSLTSKKMQNPTNDGWKRSMKIRAAFQSWYRSSKLFLYLLKHVLTDAISQNWNSCLIFKGKWRKRKMTKLSIVRAKL